MISACRLLGLKLSVMLQFVTCYIPGQSAKVWHDDGRVVPGDVVPAEVVDGHEEDVGRASHQRHWQEEEESQKAGAGHLEPLCLSANILFQHKFRRPGLGIDSYHGPFSSKM